VLKNDYTKIKQDLVVEITKALQEILEQGFGEIRIVIDKDREIYDVIPSPRIRVKY